jgi:hypothetical protein
MGRVDRTAFPKLKSQMPPPSSLSLSNPPTSQRKNIFKLITIGDRLLHAAIIVLIQYISARQKYMQHFVKFEMFKDCNFL